LSRFNIDNLQDSGELESIEPPSVTIVAAEAEDTGSELQQTEQRETTEPSPGTTNHQGLGTRANPRKLS
jgi:hypothetical protein